MKGKVNHLKKAYTKPELYFENFSLMNSIANTCDTQLNSAELGVCGYEDAFGIVFNTGVTNTSCTVNGASNGGGQCTELPQNGWNIYGS